MRTPRSLPPLTLFHDPASPLSRSLLARLPALLSPSSSSSATSQAHLGPGEAYLQRARDGEAPLAELEVRSKRSEPPTETQWRLIRQYAVAQPSSSSAPPSVSEHLADTHAPAGDGDTHKAVQGSPATAPDGKTRARLLAAKREHAERSAKAAAPSDGKVAQHEQAQAEQTHSAAAAAADDELPIRLRDGPLLVHWDAGLVAMDERGVEAILRSLKGEGAPQEQASWCVVA